MSAPPNVLQMYDIQDEFETVWKESNNNGSEVSLDIGPNSGSSSAVGLNNNVGKFGSDDKLGLWKVSLLRELTRKNGASLNSGLPNDEADPLGSTTSVMGVLKARGVDIESDPNVRNKYLISSRSFDPKIFLRDVHVDATFQNLEGSLNYLHNSIEKRSDALRGLVEHDYDRFVKSKLMLDSVLEQLDKTGFTSDKDLRLGNVRRLLDDANTKATMVMKPVVDHQATEERLKAALELIDKNRYLFNLPSLILKHIQANDHDSLVRDYRRGRDLGYNDELPPNAPENLVKSRQVTDRIWNEVDSLVENYKKSLWKDLAKAGVSQNYMQILAALLDLGVEDNPIVEWIDYRFSYFNEKTADMFDRLRLRTNMMAANLSAVPPTPEASFYNPLKQIEAVPDGEEEGVFLCDAMEVIEMWLIIKGMIGEISQLIFEVCTFWQICNGFIRGQKQAALPIGYQGDSKVHLTLSDTEVDKIKKSGKSLVEMLIKKLVEYFTLPASRGLIGALNSSSSNNNNSSSNTSNSRRQSQPLESFLFLPPHANCLGSVRYLTIIQRSLSSAFHEIARSNFPGIKIDAIRIDLSKITERIVYSICKSWQEDSERFALVENWHILPEKKSCTKFPRYFLIYSLHTLSGIHNIVFDDSFKDLIAENSRKILLQQVLTSYSAFVTNSLYNVVMNTRDKNAGDAISGSSHHHHSLEVGDPQVTVELTPQELSQESKRLFTLSNFSEIRTRALPQILSYMTKELRISTKELSYSLVNEIQQLEGPLLDAYTRKKRSVLSEIIRHGIHKSDINWQAQSPFPSEVSSYIYECLLQLVIVHARVSEIAPQLVDPVISVLYKYLLKQLLSTIREVERFGVYGALQVMVDTEFLTKVLKEYRNPESEQTCEHILKTVRDASNDQSIWNNHQITLQRVQTLVSTMLKKSKLDFSCFL